MEARVRSILSFPDGSLVTVEALYGGHEVIFNAAKGKYKVGDKVLVKHAGLSEADGFVLATPEKY